MVSPTQDGMPRELVGSNSPYQANPGFQWLEQDVEP
jgi:hypothetical protein